MFATTRTYLRRSAVCATLPLLTIWLAPTAYASDWSTLVSDGKASVDFRYRFEFVNQDGFDKDAEASTLRSRLTLESAEVSGISLLMEFDNVTSIGGDDYNSTENGNTQYPVVADPEGTDFNQFWARYTMEQASGTLGRQRILHGTQRFVGGVAWRQNEQTYDSFRVLWEPLQGLDFDYSFVNQVNRIFGPNDGANPAELEGKTHLLRLDYAFAEKHQLTGYYYHLDFDDIAFYAPDKSVNLSSATMGAEYSGSWRWLAFNAACARQEDAGDSQLNYQAEYYRAELGGNWERLNAKLGYEVLAGDNGVGFATPLATLHMFQGWADQFLSTPGDGIEDIYLQLNGKAGPVKLMAVYHDFAAESSSEDFGTELNLSATWPVNDNFTTQLTYAGFDSDSERFSDVDKVWLTLQLKL
ncbi:alginate export family protein [Candidatus Litorirhabdus singularis]|nr:alginate export family protein [Candidatus Litorirhabdus singularis]